MITKTTDHRNGLQVVADHSYDEHYPHLAYPNDYHNDERNRTAKAGQTSTKSGEQKQHYDWFPCFYKGWALRNVTHKKKLAPFIA